MRSRTVISIIAMTLSAAAAIPPRMVAQDNRDRRATLIEFDAPGAAKTSSPACAPYCGTVAYDNNDFGDIVGFYTDANIIPHGFLRAPNGHITSFDAPGAGLGHGLNQGTAAYAINDFGVIAGQFQDSSYVYHGFVRYWDGSFITFDEPDAGTGANQGTLAYDINLVGTTAGVYIDASNVQHGFVRSRNDFASFDPTGSVLTYVCEETCLNPDGTVAGFYFDSSFTPHGFVRQPDGTITSFDAPGAIGTVAASITPYGVIGGYFLDSSFVSHGFVRHRDGSFTTFDDPEAGAGTTPPPQGTYPFSISLGGATTGEYFDASGNGHGFERFPDERFANFDAPGAAPGPNAGTRPSTNNAEGEVAGWYVDAGGLNHGFLWIPGRRDDYALSLRNPSQDDSALPNPAVRLSLDEGISGSMQRQMAISRFVSRLPVPEKVRALLLKRTLAGELEMPCAPATLGGYEEKLDVRRHCQRGDLSTAIASEIELRNS